MTWRRNPVTKFFRDVNLGLHWREVELLGKCSCGQCPYWKVRWRGKELLMREGHYDRLRWLKTVAP